MNTQTKAVNGIGWQVEKLTPTGWTACSEVLPTKEEAESVLWAYQVVADAEFRVYEALEVA